MCLKESTVKRCQTEYVLPRNWRAAWYAITASSASLLATRNVGLEVVDAGAGRHHGVQPTAHAQQVPGFDVASEEAVDGPWTPLAPMPVRREVLLVRKDRVGREEVR